MIVKELNREKIIETVIGALEPLDYVYAAWQCGSAAFGRVDAWSDIDIAVDVEDDKLREIYKVVDKALEALSPIEEDYESPQILSEGSYQKVYKLKGTSKFLVIEICAVKHSAEEKFLQREIHGNIIVNFDKADITKNKTINKDEFAKNLKSRVLKLEKLFNIYQFLVDKELNRNNYLEAFAFYQRFSLSPLLEVLRIKYNPFRYNFGTRYVYYELPKDVSARLEKYYFVKDGEDLKVKHEEVIEWFKETIDELKQLDLTKLL